MPLSDWLLLPEERENPASRIDAAHPEAGWTTGNAVRPLVHGATYFAELHERIGRLGEGDRCYFVDWRGDPDQLLTNRPGTTLTAALVGAAERGADVRGLLWRSHWRHLGYHSEKHRFLGELVEQAGGQCLRDMRVRTFGAHHQKFVVLRHRDDPTRDIAFVGGIDICHSRRDDARHHGDPQALPIAAAYGPNPAWHDVHVAVEGPAVYDVETTFRERWEDSTPLTLNPGRVLSSLAQGEDQTPQPLGEQWPPPPVTSGHEAIQVARTYPAIRPKGYDFAPDGERSIALANAKAAALAERLIYIEDQYFWSEQVGEHFATVLRERPEVRLVVVLPMVPDLGGLIGEKTQLYARSLALDLVQEAGGDRVAVFGLTNDAGLPIYVHSKVCIIDDRWVSVGSDNLNRRSWTSDSEIACLVVDDRLDGSTASAGPAPDDTFALRLRGELVAEHLGCAPEDLPTDPHDLFDTMVAAARTLDAWYATGASAERHGLRSLPARAAAHTRRRRGRRMQRARIRAATQADAHRLGERPPGHLRFAPPPDLTRLQRRWTPVTYSVFDPDGTVLRDEDLGEMTTPDV